MKKIMTLLFATALFAAAHAQSSKDEARRVVLGQPKQTTASQQSRNIILGRNGQRGKTATIYKTNQNGVPHYGKKNNPGKHLGWYKGVGNPHRYGVKPGKGNKQWKHDKDDD
jgi:hypothetical protein